MISSAEQLMKSLVDLTNNGYISFIESLLKIVLAIIILTGVNIFIYINAMKTINNNNSLRETISDGNSKKEKIN